MFRYAAVLALLVISLVGCSAAPKPSADRYTGKPTAALVELRRQQSHAQQAILGAPSLPAMGAGEADDEALTADVMVQRTNAFGHVIFERHYITSVPRDATSVQIPVELPAEQNYQATAVIYDPNKKADESNLALLEIAPNESFSVMDGALNSVAITSRDPDYQIVAPYELYSGGVLVPQITLNPTPVYGDRVIRVNRFYGLNPWVGNGTAEFWAANGGHKGKGIPNTGWFNEGQAPQVNQPTTLYYQFSMCTPAQLADGPQWMCAYVPDANDGEPLFEIIIYPEPDGF